MFCFPAKYPFKTLEIDTNGSVSAIAIKIGPASGSFNNVVAIKSCVKKIIRIKMALIARIRAIADVRMRMLRPFDSATNLDIDIGMASVAIVNKRE